MKTNERRAVLVLLTLMGGGIAFAGLVLGGVFW